MKQSWHPARRAGDVIRNGSSYDTRLLLCGASPAVCTGEVEKTLVMKSSIEEEFPKFDYKKETVSYRKDTQIKPRVKRQETETESKYLQVKQDIDFMTRLESAISAYDQNHLRKMHKTSEEFKNTVIDPLERRMKRELTGERYQQRRHMMQPDPKLPPHNIDPLVVKTRRQDRTVRRKRADRRTARVEMKVTGVMPETPLEEIPAYNRTVDNPAKRDTRFFDGGPMPAKGTRIFACKYRSEVGSALDQFHC